MYLARPVAEVSVQEVYDQRAGFYDRVMNVVRHKATRAHLLRSLPLPQHLSPQARILDLGCGTGLVTDFLLKHYPGVAVTGLDVAEKMLAIHHKKYPMVPLIIGDFNAGRELQSFPNKQPVTLLPASFDLIISTGALSEYGKPHLAIPWCYVLLKPGGILINIGVHDNGFGALIGWLWHFTPFGAREFVAACRQAGFTQAEVVTSTWRVFPKNLTDYTVRAVK